MRHLLGVVEDNASVLVYVHGLGVTSYLDGHPVGHLVPFHILVARR